MYVSQILYKFLVQSLKVDETIQILHFDYMWILWKINLGNYLDIIYVYSEKTVLGIKHKSGLTGFGRQVSVASWTQCK